MPFDLNSLPSQAIFPLGIALAYLALCFYLLLSRRPEGAIERTFLIYLGLTIVWDLSLLADAINSPLPIPGITWEHIAIYGLIILGISYWTFGQAFLHGKWQNFLMWGVGIIGLAGIIILDLQLFSVSPEYLTWSQGWVTEANLSFVSGTVLWGLFVGLIALTALVQQFRTESPAHRNRIRYLLISTILFAIGYGLYLSLRDPLWTIGLIITAFAGTLATYIVVTENLVDLSTAARRIIRGSFVVLVTVSFYITGLYLVQIFLGDFLLTTFSGIVDETLLITSITVIFLAIFYMPIRRFSQRIVNRFLLAQGYNANAVIQSYGQVVSNRLYLTELAEVATKHIEEALGLKNSALFMLEAISANQIILRALPNQASNGTGRMITLQKNTPITQHLMDERSPLAQYSIDISPRFKQSPAEEREALKKLSYEWFIPITKERQLVGLLAVGTKMSGRPYTARDLELLKTLADQTALALENATLFDRVQRNLEEITRMKHLMDGVFDSMDNGVLTTDTAGKLTFFNRAAETILGKRLDQELGASYTEVLPTFADTVLVNLVKNVIENADHYNDYEIASNIPERGPVNLGFSLSSLKDARNQSRGVTIVMDDLTETKRLQAVHDMFRRYVSPAVVDRLPSNPSDLELGGHRQEVTILFADIRGFTSFSEHLTPEDLVDVLNQYLSMAASSILAYEGTLDKFMGDAVMGIFNAPLRQDDHVLRAVRAAAAMQRAIEQHHQKIGKSRALQFGVGIHVGEVVVGNIGMSDRMDYTAIGDAVNLAKRIQENTPGGKVLMSEDVFQSVGGDVEAFYYEEIQVKGRQQPVKLYELRVT